MARPILFKPLLPLVALALATAAMMSATTTSARAAAADQPKPWDARYVNPRETENDLLLPLPCGGAMAFRRAATPAAPNPLADRAIRLGGTNPDSGFLDYVRQGYVMGAFGPEGDRYYLIGKYEVTRDQFAAVMNDACPKPSMGGRLPQTGISWFDAVAFTERLTTWLLQHAADALPRDAAGAFVRLPTEAEWEYAARGGAAVSETEFGERLFPMEGPIGDYAWHKGAQSANNRLNPVGLKRPNPLGLYDILGNAEEIILEPFRLNRVGRLHGQAGALLTKGGSYQEPPGRLRSSMRREYPLFNPVNGEPSRFPGMGFRVVLAGPAMADLEQASALQKAWREASAVRDAPTDDALADLERMVDQTEDLEMRARLSAIATQVKIELAARNEIEARALRSGLLNGALLLRALRDDRFLLAERQRMVDALAVLDTDSAKRRRTALEADVATLKERIALMSDVFVASLQRIVDDYEPQRIKTQQGILSRELMDSGQASLLRLTDNFVEEVAFRRDNPDASRDDLLRRVLR